MNLWQLLKLYFSKEPYFVLRGQDITALSCVKNWIIVNIPKEGIDNPKMQSKIKSAQKVASAMHNWKNKKFPD